MPPLPRFHFEGAPTGEPVVLPQVRSASYGPEAARGDVPRDRFGTEVPSQYSYLGTPLSGTGPGTPRPARGLTPTADDLIQGAAQDVIPE